MGSIILQSVLRIVNIKLRRISGSFSSIYYNSSTVKQMRVTMRHDNQPVKIPHWIYGQHTFGTWWYQRVDNGDWAQYYAWRLTLIYWVNHYAEFVKEKENISAEWRPIPPISNICIRLFKFVHLGRYYYAFSIRSMRNMQYTVIIMHMSHAL